MKSVVQRVLEEFIRAGKMEEDELDDAAKAVLEKMEAKVGWFDVGIMVEGVPYRRTLNAAVCDSFH